MPATLTNMARRYGRETGEAMASWITFDDAAAAQRMVAGLEDCDPEVMDSIREPNLSGEFADDATPASLARELGIDPEDERIDDYCSAWEETARRVFWQLVERAARRAARG